MDYRRLGNLGIERKRGVEGNGGAHDWYLPCIGHCM